LPQRHEPSNESKRQLKRSIDMTVEARGWIELASKKNQGPGPSPMAGAVSELTPREREVAVLVADGASSKEAGRRLGISPRTVELHRAHIMEKLGARNAADLVRIVLSGSLRL
jgi:DNA-binding CsgD family transcriptional regulator